MTPVSYRKAVLEPQEMLSYALANKPPRRIDDIRIRIGQSNLYWPRQCNESFLFDQPIEEYPLDL